MSKLRFGLTISIATLTHTVALATVPATEGEILCSSNHFVVARVLKAKGTGEDFCRDAGNFEDCSSAGDVDVEVEVKRILAQKSPRVRVGNRLSLSISLVNGFWFGKPIPDFDGHLAVSPPTAKLLTKEQINRILVGSTFIFAYAPKPNETEPPSSSIYRLKKEQWVMGQLNKPNKLCVPEPGIVEIPKQVAK